MITINSDVYDCTYLYTIHLMKLTKRTLSLVIFALTSLILVSLFKLSDAKGLHLEPSSLEENTFLAESGAHGNNLFAQSARTSRNEDKPILIFGFSADSPPVSSGANADRSIVEPTTFCGALYSHIRNRFSGEEEKYSIKQVPLYSSQRFRGFQESSISDDLFIEDQNSAELFFEKNSGIECGPNSIRGFRIEELKKYGGSFSQDFHETSAKVLIHKDNRKSLYGNNFPLSVKRSEGNLDSSQIIAVVGGDKPFQDLSCRDSASTSLDDRAGGTTTIDAINTIYGAKVKAYAVRGQAVNCLVEEETQTIAYSSDHILLQGLLSEYERNQPKLKDFVIEPKTHNLTYERYGVVVYGDNEIKEVVDNWILDSGRRFMQEKSSSLAAYRYKIEGGLSQKLWRPLSDFYRVRIPIFLASLSAFSTFLLFIASVFFTLLLFSHRWIASVFAKVFPQLVGSTIRIRRFLRREGDDKNIKMLRDLGRFGLGPEEVYAQAIKDNQGKNSGKIDDYDISRILEVQLRVSRYLRQLEVNEGVNIENAKESVVEDVANQMKHNPRTRKVIEEWMKHGSDSFVDNFGSTFGRELAIKFLQIVTGQSSKTDL